MARQKSAEAPVAASSIRPSAKTSQKPSAKHPAPTNFPRGGASELTPLEYRDVTDKVKQDLFLEGDNANAQDPSTDAAASGSKRRRSAADADSGKEKNHASKRSKASSAGSSKTASTAPVLSFKRLNVGMQLVGVVRDIDALQMTVSLPGHLTGYVSIAEISEHVSTLAERAAAKDDDNDDEDDGIPSLDSLFAPGQPLVCKVMSLEHESDGAKKKRIDLSIRPDQLNSELDAAALLPGLALPASVVSQEDHGYIMSLGISGVAGFLRNDQAKAYLDARRMNELPAGTVLLVNISSIDSSRRNVSLSIDPKIIAETMIGHKADAELQHIRAGSLVPIKIDDVLEEGLAVSAHRFFKCTIDILNLSSELIRGADDISKRFKIGDKLKARVLHVDHANKRIVLSLLPLLVQWQLVGLEDAPEIGAILDQIKVMRVDPNRGLLVSLPPHDLKGYVSISKISDEHVEKIDKSFRSGSIHRGRVVGIDLCSMLVNVSFEKKVLSKPFLRHADIHAGSTIKGKIVQVLSLGVVVAVTDTIRGFCPRDHFSDNVITKPQKLFPEGETKKFHVLVVEPDTKKLILTHKKSLINSELNPITSYAFVQPGQIAIGTIAAVKSFGCIVKFYNNVQALVALPELSEAFVKDPIQMFKAGNTIKCRILSVDPEHEKMRASFKLSESVASASARPKRTSGDDDNASKKVAVIPPTAGQILSGTVVTKTENALLIRLDGNHGTSMLSKTHLSDFPAHSKKRFDAINAGDVVTDILVLSVDGQGKIHTTCKPSMIAQVRRDGHARQFTDYEQGQIVAGFVRNISEKTCFVEFCGGLVAMANVHSVSDAFVANVSDHLQIGQSVLAYITKLDTESNRMYVSLKASQLGSSMAYRSMEVERLESLVTELDSFAVKDIAMYASKFVIGQTVHGTVDKKIPYGVLVKLDGGVSGLISRLPSNVDDLDVGTKMVVRVLDFDQQTRIVDLMYVGPVNSNDRKTNVSNHASQIKAASQALESDQRVDGVVELIKDQYAMVRISKFGEAIAMCLARTPNAVTGPFVRFKIGEHVSVSVVSVPKSDATSFSAQRILVVPCKTNVEAKSLEGRRELKNPVDDAVRSLDDIKLGMVIKGVVRSIKDTQVNIRLADNLSARVHATQIYDSISNDDVDRDDPLSKFKIGETMAFKVIGFHDAKTHTYLPITHAKSSTQTIVELTCKPMDMVLPNYELSADSGVMNSRATMDDICIGSEMVGAVSRVDAMYMTVQVGISAAGTVSCLVASNDPKVCGDLAKHFNVGRLVQCFVVGKDTEKKRLDLSLVDGKSVASAKDLCVGEVRVARIVSVHASNGVVVQLSKGVSGRIQLTDIQDTLTDDVVSSVSVGQFVRVVVVGVDAESGAVECSMKQSDMPTTDTPSSCLRLSDIKPGELVSGYVRRVNENGCFVILSRHVHVRVKIADLSDKFLKDWKSLFKPGQLVTGRVMSVDVEKNHVEMSLRESVVGSASGADGPVEAAGGVGFDDLKVGQKVTGRVKRIESFGLFVELSNANGLTGLCHVSEIADGNVKDVASVYSVGDSVKAKVLRLNKAKKRVSLGLKASYFEDEDAVEEDESESESAQDDIEMNDCDAESDDENDAMEVEEEENSENNSEGDSENEFDSEGDFVEMDEDDDNQPAKMTTSNSVSLVQPLSLEGFSWDVSETNDMDANDDQQSDDDESEEDDDDEGAAKRSRRAKKRARLEQEAQISQQELAMVEGDQSPQVSEDYEKLLLGSPNNSYVWIKYMAFHLQLGEVDKARRVAERGIKSIHFREEQERLNVWVALLNLENKYGTKETLESVFSRAEQMNDAKTIYLQYVRILERSEKHDECREAFAKMAKKLKESAQVWFEFSAFLMRIGRHEQARQLLGRSLQSLPRHKHVEMTNRFAQMEYKIGEAERGRTVFEGLLSSCPKRTDLWSVYIDMEVRIVCERLKNADGDCKEDVDRVRRLFERVLARKWNSKKMKFFFKKNLEFEKKFGDERGVERVKEAAMKYVSSL